MRICCRECGSKGLIKDSDELSRDFVKIYYTWSSIHCGHRWVSSVTFSHTTTPSSEQVDRLIFDRLRELPKAKQREIFAQLG